MSHSDSIRRTIELLSRLNEGQALNVDRLAAQYGVHPRSIRRDLALIKEIFGEFIRKDGDAYRAYDKLLLDRVLHSGELMQLSGIASIPNQSTTAGKDAMASIYRQICAVEPKVTPMTAFSTNAQS